MRIDVWLIVVVVLLAALQTTLLGPMHLDRTVVPNVLLGFAVLLGLFHGRPSGLVLAWFTGYISDLTAGGFYGVYMTTRVMAYWIAYTMSGRVFVKSPMTVGAWAAAMAPFEIILAVAINAVFRSGDDMYTPAWGSISLSLLVGSAAATFVGTAILHLALRRFWVSPGEELLGS